MGTQQATFTAYCSALALNHVPDIVNLKLDKESYYPGNCGGHLNTPARAERWSLWKRAEVLVRTGLN